jgi:ribosomal protein S18 acetylase RimI-like enzyme
LPLTIEDLMTRIQYREATEKDIPAMATIRCIESGTHDYWEKRILGYMNGELNPQQASGVRNIYVASDNNTLIGFVAGHLTKRFDFEGELQWINVVPEYKRKRIGTALFYLLSAWFIQQNASRICVNVAPENSPAQKFYERLGSQTLNEHWLFWSNISMVVKRK